MKIASMNVDYVDHMGSDLTVVNAARVSFDKESELVFRCPQCSGEVVKAAPNKDFVIYVCEECGVQWDDELALPYGTRQLSKKDVKLIEYLAKHNHWSPFAHTSIQLRIKAPIFVARQLVKHQVGGVWNEVSRRYVDSEPEFWFPDVWRGRPEGSIKQGSSGEVSFDTMDLATFHTPEVVVKHCLAGYNDLLQVGVAPEQARMILPQNMMTEWYWTGSLMFFCRVCRERLAPGAQAETREVAEQIAEIVAPLFPVSWAALMEVKQNS